MQRLTSIPGALLLMLAPIVVLVDPANFSQWIWAAVFLGAGAWMLYLGMTANTKNDSGESH
jgi:hypothetical protein